MKFIPILFSTPMVQAILEGRKTMTRRIAPVPVGDHFGTDIMDWGLSKHPWKDEEGQWWFQIQSGVDYYSTERLPCKYQKGDVLWVRESFIHNPAEYDHELSSIHPMNPEQTFFKADPGHGGPGPWKPSIHMPKTLCRIFLEVLDVRVERLKDISEDDAKAEGVSEKDCRCGGGTGYYEAGGEIYGCSCQSWEGSGIIQGFYDLWDQINGTESLESNPWVWVVSFKRIDKPENFK